MNKKYWLAVLGLVIALQADGEQAVGEQPAQQDISLIPLEYIGDDFRLGIGWDSEFDLTGELQWTFSEDADSAWILDGWLADEAGGVKLNRHWLRNPVYSDSGDQENSVVTDGVVAKLFLAADRNEFDDRKLTFGGGREKENKFWSLYGSRSTTGDRLVNSITAMTTSFITGTTQNHSFTRTDTLTTVTDVFAHPYEWGVGFRLGRYFPQHALRLRGGLDYEDGKFSSSQTTLSASLEKYFRGGHGLSLRLAYADKSGDFEIDRSDFRSGLFYSYDFGTSHRSAKILTQQEFIQQPAAAEKQAKVVYNDVVIENQAEFELDQWTLTAESSELIKRISDQIRQLDVLSTISVTGHTCSLGSDAYNQSLSERRARAVADALRSALPEYEFVVAGKGESEPAYSNTVEETRRHNRRVEINFISRQQDTVYEEVSAEPVVSWRQVEVPQDAAWIRRALRNPVQHKRQVDFYRYETSTSTLVEGEPVIQNAGPDAVDDSYEVELNSSDNSLDVLVNDSDADGDTITITAVSDPGAGQVSIDGSSLSYTPAADFTGSDQFQYTIEDGFGGSDTATVTITVFDPNLPPMAEDDAATTSPDTPVTIDVLANDSDPEGGVLSIESVSDAANGSVEIVNNGVVYTPASGFTGQDSFSYTVIDEAGATDSANVTVDVIMPNQPPVAVDDSANTIIPNAVSIDVLANDSDPEGGPLTIIAVGAAEFGTPAISGNTIVFMPDSAGVSSFSYTIADDAGATASATVTVTIETDLPPQAQDDSAVTDANVPITIDVLANDSDPEGQALVLTSVSTPAHGSAVITANAVLYTPDADYVGADTFTYIVEDPNGSAATATVSVEVRPENQPPRAFGDLARTSKNTSVVINVLANDIDPDGDPLTVIGVSQGANPMGTVEINADGTITYTPNPGWWGGDFFMYTISDGRGGTDTGVVRLTVTND